MPPSLQTLSSTAAGLAVVVVLLASSAMPVTAKVVDKPKLASHCAEEAADELDVDEDDLLILPVEKNKGIFHVYGQYPDHGSNPTLFECTFDEDRRFRRIEVTGHHGHHGEAAGKAPRRAQRACLDMIGGDAEIEQFSDLRRGYHEIIMDEGQHGRRVACTVSDDGTIEDWVELD